MKISQNCNVNFRALEGKREITYFHGSGIDTVTLVQHIHPFKDEFKTQEDKDKALEKYKKEISAQRPFDNVCHKFQIVLEKALPFTKEEFLLAKQSPNAKGVSKEALDFISSDDYATETIKHTGYFRDVFV